MSAIKNAFDRMTAKEQKDTAAALKTWRECAYLLADNTDLSAKQVTDLADAMEVLKLDRAALEADVAAIHTERQVKPIVATAEADVKELEAKQQQSLKDEEEYRNKAVREPGVRAMLSQRILAICQQQQRYAATLRDHPRVFG